MRRCQVVGIVVVTIAAALAATAQAAPSFAGTWETTYGEMTLAQQGNQVSGYYTSEGERCTVEGQVSGARMTFTYREPRAAGEGWFELDASGRKIAGQWRPSDRATWDVWVGTRQAAEKPAPSFAGVWQTSFGPMRLHCEGEKVSGIYAYADGSTISGTVAGSRLTFEYQEPAAAGQGWFELDPGGDTFAGQWRSGTDAEWQAWDGRRLRPEIGRKWLVVVEARWETSLSEREYSFGEMLQAFFARTPNIEVRHRFFTDEGSLRSWIQDTVYLPEPVVLVIATHGSPAGLFVNGRTIGADALAESLRHAGSLELVHFSACEIFKDRLAKEIMAGLGAAADFPLSGYTTSVDWAASAIIELTYLDLILAREMTPAAAAAQLQKLLPFAGDRTPAGACFAPAGFQIITPKHASRP